MANAKVAQKSKTVQENKSKDKAAPPQPPIVKPAENAKAVTPPSQANTVADAPAALSQAPATAPAGVRMPTINDVRVAGRLTRDPIIREVGNQNVANFDIAVEKRYRDSKNEWQKQVSFIPVAIWGVVADRSRDFLHKGSPVYLEGRLRSNSWQTKDGQKRTTMQLEAFKVQSLARGQNRSQGQEVGE